ncbi:hypothetical protein L195_g051443, partial [Trifolium pratense]
LSEKNLIPYVGPDLQGFNGSTTKLWGYVDLINYTGRAVRRVIHHTPEDEVLHSHDQVATINGDIAATRRCFEAAAKNLNTVVTPKKPESKKDPGVNAIGASVDLDARLTKKEHKEDK